MGPTSDERRALGRLTRGCLDELIAEAKLTGAIRLLNAIELDPEFLPTLRQRAYPLQMLRDALGLE